MTLNAEVAEVRGQPIAEEQLGALTLGGFLREVCEKNAHKEALVFYPASGPVIRKTYADVWRESFAIARALVPAWAWVAALLAATSTPLVYWSCSAMETSLACALLLATLLAGARCYSGVRRVGLRCPVWR